MEPMEPKNLRELRELGPVLCDLLHTVWKDGPPDDLLNALATFKSLQTIHHKDFMEVIEAMRDPDQMAIILAVLRSPDKHITKVEGDIICTEPNPTIGNVVCKNLILGSNNQIGGPSGPGNYDDC